MAPDRGVYTALLADLPQPSDTTAETTNPVSSGPAASRDANMPSGKAAPIEGRSFTARGIAVGLGVGLIICFSNMYFGLQTGWVSTMTMPASLLGFGFFKTVSRHLKLPFSPVENVLVQTVAGSMAIMPLGCGFVGVIPAMNYLLSSDEQGPLELSIWKLILWSLGLCYFGVVFAVPLRRQVIIKEQLKFPSGFSTAVLISVLHGKTNVKPSGPDGAIPATFAALAASDGADTPQADNQPPQDVIAREGSAKSQEWKRNLQLLLVCFAISGLSTFATYFVPILRDIPIFGHMAATAWLWTLNPSLAYVGQGVIMGPATTIHMLIGAIFGWGVLSPLAKKKGWAPGPVGNWETGSKGWIIWASLAIMLADAIVSLGFLALRPAIQRLTRIAAGDLAPAGGFRGFFLRRFKGYTMVDTADDGGDDTSTPTVPAGPLSDLGQAPPRSDDPLENDVAKAHDEDDAPQDEQISDRIVGVGLILSVGFCILCTHIVFGDLLPLYANLTAVLMALVLSIMGVRALGETDLNPVSGISKLAQLFFALIVPQSNKSSVLINLIAGAVSEAGALQAGDLMQDLKTGHLLGAAPKAQFWGQVIGATAGAVASAFIYLLYTTVYQVPGDLFQVPTGYVWISTARLVTGKGLPPMAKEWAFGSAILFAVITALRIYYRSTNSRWHDYIPGGIAVAVGMYNVPSFTLARTIGGVLSWWWRSRMGWEDTPLIVLASGFILGEGFLSIINLIMESIGVPHL